MNINILKPKKENLTNYIVLGGFFIFIALLDLLTNVFFNWNFTGFLPAKFSYFTPLIFGTLGLYLIRIEFSGNNYLIRLMLISIRAILMRFLPYL